MIDKERFNLLQIQKIKKVHRFLSNIEGPIITKGSLKSRTFTEHIKKQFANDAREWNWVAPPRARLAVRFTIYCHEKNPPEIYKIIKCYLDLLKGAVFIDDRQVHYLEAYIYKLHDIKQPSSIFIEAKRLLDFNKLLDIYQEYFDYTYEEEETPFNCYHEIDQRHWEVAERQAEIFSNSIISAYDRPGLKNYLQPTMMSRFNGIDPGLLDFGELPKVGGSELFKQKVSNEISNFKHSYRILQKLYTPIELDIQVTQNGLKLLKDLDNIILNIGPEFRKQILHDQAYINGFRAYVVSMIGKNCSPGIKLKILPKGAIHAYRNKLEKTLEKAEESLKHK